MTSVSEEDHVVDFGEQNLANINKSTNSNNIIVTSATRKFDFTDGEVKHYTKAEIGEYERLKRNQ